MPSYKIVKGVKIAEDALVRIWINNKIVAELVSNPELLEELGIGYAYSEGYINTLGEIREVATAGHDVKIKLVGDVATRAKKVEECGIGEFVKIKSPRRIHDYRQLTTLATEFAKLTIWNVDPHLAMHTSALYLDEEWAVIHDTSRHSSVIKLIGMYLKRGKEAESKIAFTTGRVSSDMVYRLATIGVGAVVSLRGPLYSGVEAACKLGIQLVTNIRNKGFTELCP
ncbi:Uncharacterized protein required for formate dehydrogenase activity [Pyrobaculum oguniense TE7]|uniref:Uncharacterized protein required for formate dehydrogenase activity n=1 Tax=Pyrobaculum oguniense (strain DSM 13380 / JCM 10595 / TE7) TaxID=698757 RepID=H6Q944_PYROT|nr:Uncharacterized protein required for formate dehydrogenase activity [Pyrobaculum oguniense TE7]